MSDTSEQVKDAFKRIKVVGGRFRLPFLIWLGGAMEVMHEPGMNFWDGVIWLYYVGRYIASNFTILHS